MPSYGFGGPDPLPDQTGEDLMNTITNDPGLPGGPLSHARPTAPTCCFTTSCARSRLTTCEIVITAENAGPAVKAARDLLRAFGIEPGHGEP